MIDQKTTHLQLPLPHPDNELEEDILRLRDALSAIDEKHQALDVLLKSDDISLDDLQEIVTAIKSARTDIGGLNALISAQLDAQNALITNQLAAQNVFATKQISDISALVYAGL